MCVQAPQFRGIPYFNPGFLKEQVGRLLGFAFDDDEVITSELDEGCEVAASH